tara:strand:- start:73 stop:627 length:555 start_codon:yes stop_codon:yes gene_type:complete
MEYTFYKLSIGDKCYIGSTADFHNRTKSHRNDCNNENGKNYNYKLYQYIRENGCWNDVKVMIIDKIIYNHKEQAREMETKFMLMFNAELNSRYPKRSIKEWYVDNRERETERGRKYYEKNKDQVRKRCEKYRETNREIIRERSKDYYETNKEKIEQKRGEKITCDLCGKMMRKDSMSKHKKSQH